MYRLALPTCWPPCSAVLLSMGYMYLDAGEHQQAGHFFEQSYALSMAIGLKTGIEEATEALQEVTT